jgi:ribosomal protein L23
VEELTGIEVTQINTVVNPKAPEKKYLHFVVARNVDEDLTVEKAGLIYYKGNVEELTKDTEGAIEKVSTSTANSGAYGTNIEDTGDGVTVVGYVVIDGKYYYGEVIHKTHTEVKMAETAQFEVTQVNTVVNPNAPEKNYLHFVVARNIAEEFTVEKTGLIFYKGNVDELTKETADAVEKVSSSTANVGSYGTNIEDTGDGVTIVGYAVIDGEYYYGDVVHENYADIKKAEIDEKMNIKVAQVNTAVNPNAPEKKYIHYVVSRNVDEELTVEKAGLIFYKGDTAELTKDTAGAVIKVSTSTANTGSYGTNIEDTGNGVTIVGYVVVDGEYYYGEVVHNNYDEIR